MNDRLPARLRARVRRGAALASVLVALAIFAPVVAAADPTPAPSAPGVPDSAAGAMAAARLETAPSMTRAMMQETEPDKEDGIVLKELQKGYRLGEKVLRPGRVVVNKKTVEQGDDDGSDEDRE